MRVTAAVGGAHFHGGETGEHHPLQRGKRGTFYGTYHPVDNEHHNVNKLFSSWILGWMAGCGWLGVGGWVWVPDQ